MATYTGFLTESGLAELASEGEVDFAAMTLRRAVHVNLRDSGGNPVKFPDPPGSSEDDPAHVVGTVEITGRPSVRPDLSHFLSGRLPVDTGLVIPVPTPPAVFPAFPKTRALDFETDAVDVTGSQVKITSLPEVRLDLSRYTDRLLPVNPGPSIKSLIRREWVFTAAQSNLALVSVTAAERIAVVAIKAKVSAAGTVNVAVRIGFATSALTAVSSNAAGGIVGLLISDPAIPPGSGELDGGAGAVIGLGAAGENLLLTSGVATGGALRIIATYAVLPA